MSASEKFVRGETTLTYADNLRGLRPMLIWLHTATAALLTVMLLGIRAWFMTEDDWSNARNAPLAEAAAAFSELAPIVVGALAFMFFGGLVWNWLAFRRLPKKNLDIAIEADDTRIVTRDAAQFEFVLPWSSVIRTRNSEKALFLKLDTGAWRFVPWRAFASDEDRAQILRWAEAAAANRQGCAAK